MNQVNVKEKCWEEINKYERKITNGIRNKKRTYEIMGHCQHIERKKRSMTP